MKIVHNESQRRFELYDDGGERIGEIEYRNGGNRDLYATHTEVNPQHEGKGYAKQLLNALADFAERNHYKIVPVCPYVTACFRKDPDRYAAVTK